MVGGDVLGHGEDPDDGLIWIHVSSLVNCGDVHDEGLDDVGDGVLIIISKSNVLILRRTTIEIVIDPPGHGLIGSHYFHVCCPYVQNTNKNVLQC